MLWVPVLGAILLWAPPPAPALRTLQRGQSYQISPKPCSVNGVDGTCMFVWQCIQSEGKHVGMCVDTFMFGSCCSHNLSHNAVLPSSSEPAVLYSPSGNKYSPVFTARPTHGPNSSSYTTTSHKFKPAHGTGNKTQMSTSHKYTARPPGANHIISNSRPNFISSGSNSNAKYPSHGKPYKPYNGYSSPSPKPYDNHSSESSEKTSKPAGLPERAPSTEVAYRPPHTNHTSWVSKSPPVSNSMNPSGSSLVGVWASQKLPASTLWQASTEPGFVTRPRPSSHRPRPPPRLRPTRRPTITTTPLHPTATSTTAYTTTTTSTTTTTRAATTTTSTTTQVIPTMPSTTTAPTTTMAASTTQAQDTTSTLSSVSAYNKEKSGQCGVTPLYPRPEMRIVGGKNAQFGGWPWQVSVRRTSFFGFSSTHRCGGAVLNERWIATAGHCVDDLLTSQIRIRVGEYDFSSVQEPHPFIERSVTRKVVHPKYNFFTYEYDLALVQLEVPLTFAPHIAPICLPASDDLLIGENATVTGWGRLSEGGTLPSVLQQVSVPIVSNDQCKSMFLRAGRHEFIPEIFLCAGYQTGGQDSCQGDSGGPLQVRGKDGRYFLAGIISWGIGCAEANLPGVCTRISKFVHWILDNVT